MTGPNKLSRFNLDEWEAEAKPHADSEAFATPLLDAIALARYEAGNADSLAGLLSESQGKTSAAAPSDGVTNRWNGATGRSQAPQTPHAGSPPYDATSHKRPVGTPVACSNDGGMRNRGNSPKEAQRDRQERRIQAAGTQSRRD